MAQITTYCNTTFECFKKSKQHFNTLTKKKQQHEQDLHKSTYIIHVHNIHYCSKFKAQLLHFMCNKIYI